jgi:hypothetical protein
MQQRESVKWQYFLVGVLLGAGGLYYYLESQKAENATGTGTNTSTNTNTTNTNTGITPSPAPLAPCNCNTGTAPQRCGCGTGGGVTILTTGIAGTPRRLRGMAQTRIG